MFPVVVEQIHKFAQVNQSYINIYNLWFFHWRFIWSNVWWKIIIRSVLCDNKKKFIKLMHQKSMIVVIIHWCWKVIFHREDFNNISECTQRDDRKKRTTKTLVCDKRDRPMTYAFCGDLHLSQCFLVFYKKTCSKEGEVCQKCFSNKIIVTLVTQDLSSFFLSRPVA